MPKDLIFVASGAKSRRNRGVIRIVRASPLYRRVARIAAAAVVLLGLTAAEPGAAGGPQVLVIASQSANPPFSALRSDGTLGGFEIDLGKALCAEMGVTCRFRPGERTTLIAGLLAHRYDAVMSALTITPARRKLVAFSERYAQIPAVFVARKAAKVTAIDPAALAGKRLGAQQGTVYADYLAAYAAAGAQVRLYATAGEAELDLANGNLDAVLGNKAALMAWMGHAAGAACCDFVGRDLRDPQAFGSGIGIALRREDDSLRTRFNSALAQLLANGTFGRIDARYFPFDIYGAAR